MHNIFLAMFFVVLVVGCSNSDISSSSGSTFTVTFDTNGGSDISDIRVRKNKTASEPKDPDRENHDFGGWYTDENFTTPFDFGATITENITLYANWTLLPGEGEKLSIDDKAFSHFGSAVAVYGNYAIAGAPERDDAGASSGSAYIVSWDGIEWSNRKQLNLGGQTPYSLFGASVAIYGDYVAVGAIGGLGAAYIFSTSDNDLQPIAELVASDEDQSNDNNLFGISLAISADYVAVGAPSIASVEPNTDSVYIFKKDESADEWTEQVKLASSETARQERFGVSISAYEDYLIVGAPNNSSNGAGAGAAYVFKLDKSTDSWSQGKGLTANALAAGEQFGESVAIYGNYAVIGAPGADTAAATDSGAVYVFKRDASDDWKQDAKLTASDLFKEDYFGGSVAIYGNYIVVGAELDDDNSSYNSGSVYVFERDESDDTWNQVGKLTYVDAENGDSFGSSVAISKDTFVVGSPGDDGQNEDGLIIEDAGSVVFFRDYSK